MRKNNILLISFSIIFLISLIGLISAGTCTMSGYANCYEYSYDYGTAHAYAKVYFNMMDDKGVWTPNAYAIKKFSIDIGFQGDKLYYYNNLANWNNIVCDDGGCFGGQQISQGQNILANVGEQYTNCPAYLAWDRNDNGQNWAWTYAGYGWTGSGNCFNVKVVNCYQDNQCNSGYYCDKSGDWKTWDCKFKECENGQDKTDSSGYYKCESYKWVRKGECKTNEEKCIASALSKCENYNWVNKGGVVGKCGAECTNISQNKCVGLDYYTCDNYKFTINRNVGKCGVECTIPTDCGESSLFSGWDCTENKCIKKSNLIPIISVVAVILAVIGFTFLLIKLRKKKRKR